MALYTVTTDLELYTDIGLTEYIIIDDTNSNNIVVIPWKNIPIDIQSTFEETITSYGGNMPIIPTSANSSIFFNTTIIGGNSTGLLPTLYNFNINIDGTLQNVSIDGSNSLTFSALIIELTSKISGATATISNDIIIITSDTSGNSSVVELDEFGMIFFNSMIGYSQVISYHGINNMNDLIQYNKHSNGATFESLLIAQFVFLGNPRSSNNIISDTTISLGSNNVTNIISLTQAEYDLIISPLDDVLYIVV